MNRFPIAIRAIHASGLAGEWWQGKPGLMFANQITVFWIAQRKDRPVPRHQSLPATAGEGAKADRNGTDHRSSPPDRSTSNPVTDPSDPITNPQPASTPEETTFSAGSPESPSPEADASR